VLGGSPVNQDAWTGIVHCAGEIAFSKRVAWREKASMFGVVLREYP
jgi:hypothetical protein